MKQIYDIKHKCVFKQSQKAKKTL